MLISTFVSRSNPHWRIALCHIMPNVLPPLIVQVTLSIASAVIAETSLSLLGMGQQPPQPRWGSITNTAINHMDIASWMAVWPGASIFLLVHSFNLVGMACAMRWIPRQK
jgi:peptide/nickel transport system permease protein